MPGQVRGGRGGEGLESTNRRHLAARLRAVQDHVAAPILGTQRGAGLQALFLHPLSPSSPRGSIPSGAVPVPAVGHGVERLLSHLWRGHLHPCLQPEPFLPPGDTEEALHGQTLPGPASGTPCGKRGPRGSQNLGETALTRNGVFQPARVPVHTPATSQTYPWARQTTCWWWVHVGRTPATRQQEQP